MWRTRRCNQDQIGADVSRHTDCTRSLMMIANLRAVLLIVAVGLPAEAAWAVRDQVYFAAPYSGKKVTEYTIDLPVSQDHRQTFKVPELCGAVKEAASAGASRWGTRQERNVWQKVDRDCRYHAFLKRHGTAKQDFISDVDIWNAPLCDLLVEARCLQPDARPGDSDCQPLPPGIPRISDLVEFTDSEAEEALRYAEPCRLDDGIFRGWVVADPAGNHCIPDANAPGFRVMSLDYADINGDGILDVVLRLIPLAAGASRIPLILPLTRHSPSGELQIPRDTVMPSVFDQP